MPRQLTFGAYALPSYHAESDPPQATFMQRQLDLLAAADPLGLDSVWSNEHHFDSWGGLMSAPALVLAGQSQRTQRIRLGTSIAVLGLHQPRKWPNRWRRWTSDPADYQIGTPRASAALAEIDVASLIDQARLIAGNPDEVADMLTYLQDEVGFTHLNHMFQFGGLSFDLAQQSMALYAQEVMPKLRARTSATLPVS